MASDENRDTANTFRIAIICASDTGYLGLRKDTSTRTIIEIMEANGYSVVSRQLLPDDREQLAQAMAVICDAHEADLILTTGGTGLSPRDITPEATLDIVERQVPGIPEAMRAAGMLATPKAMLSRAVAGIRGRTLIINLPGSPKAVTENLSSILPALWHGLETLTGRTQECARQVI